MASGYWSSIAVLDNHAPEVYSQNIPASANNDRMVTLEATDLEKDPLIFRILSLPGQGKLYQCLNGARGPEIVTTNSVVTDPQARVIFAPAPNTYGTPYTSFQFSASDGELESGPGTVVINIESFRGFTLTPSRVSLTSVQLNGVVVPAGISSVAWFEWGLRGIFDHTTDPLFVGSGTSLLRVNSEIDALAPGSAYTCRLVVSNAAGLFRGAAQIFTTGERIASWGDNSYGQTSLPPGLNNVVSVAAGDNHSLALTSDGTVVAWGSNSSRQTNVPAELRDVIEPAAGAAHSAALQSDGTVKAWGDNAAAQTNVPSGLTNVVKIAAGASRTMVLRADGTMAAWGSVGAVEADGLTNLNNVVNFAVGDAHTVALRSDLNVVAWGDNSYGQTNVPSDVTNVIGIAAGGRHSLALSADGKVSAWGDNAYEQTNVPAGLSNVVAVFAGDTISGANLSSGTVVLWGGNGAEPRNMPTNLIDVIAAVVGDRHALAIAPNLRPEAKPQLSSGPANRDQMISLAASDANNDLLSLIIAKPPDKGRIYQYSDGDYGALIDTTNVTVLDPMGRVIFSPDTNGSGIPYASFLFVANDGQTLSSPATVAINVQGSRAYAQFPTDLRASSATLNAMVIANNIRSVAWFEWGLRGGFLLKTDPVDIGDAAVVNRIGANVTGLSLGSVYQFRAAVSNEVGVHYSSLQTFTTGKKVRAWGSNNYGKTNVPPGLTNVVAVAAGMQHCLALKTDGEVVAWGYGASQTNVPAGLSNVVAISADGLQSLALKTDGKVVAWGGSAVPSTLSNVVAIANRGSQCLALKADGSLFGWGGMGIPPGLSNIVEIKAGSAGCVALRADGTVVSWATAVPVPEGLINAVNLAVGSGHFLATRDDGTLAGWGSDSSGQATIPPGLTNASVVAAGQVQSLALRRDGSIAAWGNNIYGLTTSPMGLTSVAAIACGGWNNFAIGEFPPTALSQVLSGVPNEEKIVFLNGTDANRDILSFRITSLPERGALYQYNGTGRGAAITASNIAVVDPGGRVVLVPTTNGFGNPYAMFSFVANGGGGVDSSPATVTISILPTEVRAFTQVPIGITPVSAVLNGMIVRSQLPSVAWFEWGAKGEYTAETTRMPIVSGVGVAPVRVPIGDLTNGGVYQCRLVLSNAAMMSCGVMQLFTTGQKVAAWGDTSANSVVPVPLVDVVAVSCYYHNLALRSDGTVAEWGRNSSGRTNVLAELRDVMAVSAGGNHSLALRSNGTVVAWGNSSSGVTNVPATATNIIGISAGFTHNSVLTTEGVVISWGSNSRGQTQVPSGLSNVVQLAAGDYHTVALKYDGTVAVWGSSPFGPVGSVPSGLSNVAAVAAGGSHSLALKADGRVIAWGENSAGQCNVPGSLSNVVAIANSWYQNLALKSDGGLVAWPPGARSNLGNVPTGLHSVSALACGAFHNLVVGNDLPPQVVSQVVTGSPNRDVVITLRPTDPNGDPLSLRIATLPIHGLLYQYTNGGVRGDRIDASNTLLRDSGWRVIFSPARNGFGSPYATLSYTASDGQTSAGPAIVTVNISALNKPSFIGAELSTNAAFQFSFSGGTNTIYCVWASADLITWKHLGPAVEVSDGQFLFADQEAKLLPRRFYRLSTDCLATAPDFTGYNRSTNGSFEVLFSGDANSAYRVWASIDLMAWQALGMATEITPGFFRFIDPSAANQTRRFYRAGTP